MEYIPGQHYELSPGEHYDEDAPKKVNADCISCGQKRNGIYRGSNASAHTYFCEEGFEYDAEAGKIIKYHSFGVETEEHKKKRIKSRNKERLKGAGVGAGATLGAVGAAKIASSAASEETAQVAAEEGTKSVLYFLQKRFTDMFNDPIGWLEDQWEELIS